MKRVVRYKRAGRRAFTLVEILISLAVVGVLFGLIFAFYRSAIDKSKYVEAVATVDSIGKAEEINQMNTGEYVAAANTQEVNEKLGLDIESKEYNYKIIGVTNDNFIVLAEKILDDINNGDLSSEPTVIARDRSGPVPPESVGAPEGEPESAPPGEGPSSPGGGSPGGGAPSGESSPVGTPVAGGPTGGGGIRTIKPSQNTLSADILNLLDGVVLGQWAIPGQGAYTLISNNNIKVVYVDVNDYGATGALAFWWGMTDHTEFINGQNVFVTGNTIFVNNHLVALGHPNTAIASIIAHEATHADYDYHPAEKILDTTTTNPFISDPFGTPLRPITASDIHIPGNSIDQEYEAFNNAVVAWNAIKGADTDVDMDYWATLQATPPPLGGEVGMKAVLRSSTAYGSLPEF